MLMVHHILGVQPEENFIRIRPKLISGLEEVKANLPIRENRIHIDMKTDTGISAMKFQSNVAVIQPTGEDILIPYSDKDVFIEAIVPEN